MERNWEEYVRERIPNISDIDLLKLLEIAESMVIKGTAATKLAAVDALIAVLRG
jgi:hypothetical protein